MTLPQPTATMQYKKRYCNVRAITTRGNGENEREAITRCKQLFNFFVLFFYKHIFVNNDLKLRSMHVNLMIVSKKSLQFFNDFIFRSKFSKEFKFFRKIRGLESNKRV